MAHHPVTTAADLDTLNDVDILEGYLDGTDLDTPEPGENRGRAYWHGWQNGRGDKTGGYRPEAVELIRDMKRNGVPLFPTADLITGKAFDEACTRAVWDDGCVSGLLECG